MKALLLVLPALLLAPAFAADAPARPATHRYMIERTFPAGALDGLNAQTKAKVNANNAKVGVRWLHSYANEDKTRTYCVYEGPSEAAIRESAKLNALPIDSITEVPADAGSERAIRAAAQGSGKPRFIVRRELAPAAAATTAEAPQRQLGVTLIGSYTSADRTVAYAVYEAPHEGALREAAMTSNVPVGAVAEIPVTLLPK